MVDVVASLRSILPEGDAFHAVGGEIDMITKMIDEGYTGNKGKGGFYLTGANGVRMARPLTGIGEALANYRVASTSLPNSAAKAAEATAQRREPLDAIITGDDAHSKFSCSVLARVLAYAASLIPDVTSTPQDIDDAMKLGFNWQRGPFELIDAIGQTRLVKLLDHLNITIPPILENDQLFYKLSGSSLTVRQADNTYSPINLPKGVIRFHLKRKSLTPILENNDASLFVLDGFAQGVNDLRLIEFHSKANALTDASMEIVSAAAKITEGNNHSQ